MEYNIHQDQLWRDTGGTIALYVNLLSGVTTNPRSYLLIPVQIPLNSQKVQYRERLVEGLDEQLLGSCTYHTYQISNWYSFSWRYKLRMKMDSGNDRLGFLYGDNVRRRLLFGDVPREGLTMIEEVVMNEFYNLPMENLGADDYIDTLIGSLMGPLASKTITIDHLHRYTDNRARFDLIFDDMRYHLIASLRKLKEDVVLPELMVFIED